MGRSIKWEGLNELHVALTEAAKLDDVKKVVKKHGADLQSNMQKKASFRGHYEGSKFVSPTGATKRSIELELKDGGLTAEVGPTTEYSEYVEYGTRFMEAQPFIGPAFNEQKGKFIDDMKKLMG